MRLAAEVHGEDAAKRIQLDIAYAPEPPPFDSGMPETTPPLVLEAAWRGVADLVAQRERTAKRIAEKLGVAF